MLCTGITAALAAPAISPILRDVETSPAPVGIAIKDVAGLGPSIDLIVTGSMSDAELEAQGAVINSRLAGGVRTIRIPVDHFAGLRTLPGMQRITASYLCRKFNNTSVPTTNATPGFWTHSGGGVFTGNAGAGIILGEVDTGIDWSSGDFKNPDGTTRILDIWDQNVTTTPPAGFAYGTEWTAAQINAGTCTHHDTDGHGTHVMGTAAGDGSATGNAQPAFQFTGMAPKADIIVVATTFQTANILDGVNYIFQKAAALGKNAVVNLSLGSQFGAHDGTEDFDTGMNALTGPGKIIVVAAGNDGNAGIHCKQLVPPGGGAQTITFNVPAYTANAGTTNDLILLDAFYPATANMTVTLTSPGPTPVTVGPVTLGNSLTNAASLAGNILVENGSTPAPGGDKNVFIQIFDSNAARPPRAGVWTITLNPVSTVASTRFDGWLAQFQLGAAGVSPAFTSDIDETALVASPGSAAQVITAGAWISKGSWPAIDGNTYQFTGLTTVGTLASFSSPGPLRNGAQKPDIAAPGTAIVSTKSQFISPAPQPPLVNPDGQHMTEAGTSMASPHVAGACALLLAESPNQTPAQLKARLTANATVDANTGVVPSGLWGFGKLHIIPAGDAIAPTVTTLTPNGGETWAAGSSHAITWSASDNVAVSSITLEYSLNNGAVWNTIATGEANDGTYSWTLPQAVSTNALVRVKALDAVPNTGADVSNAVFTIADQTLPTVAVSSPNGGETWVGGSAHAITWSANDNIGVASTTIEFSANNGGSWATVATGEANDGTFSWTVPNAPTAQGLVRVTAFDAATNTSLDVSNAAFSIVDATAPTATVSAPNGAEVWAAGSSHNITWSATDDVAVTSVTLEVSLDNGGSWLPIASGEANDGTYAWTVPQVVSVQARVRVTALDGGGNPGSDISNAAFTIADQTAPSAHLLSPNGGELLVVGAAQAITWTATDNIGVTSVDLAFSSDGGANWSPIASGEANDGNYAWTVPGTITNQAKVRVTATDGPNFATDPSDSLFSIVTTTGVPNVPSSFARPTLLPNRPNPFGNATHVGFGLARAGHVRLAIYSIDGRCVRTLADREFEAGYTELSWDGRATGGSLAPNGIYFAHFEASGINTTKRMVLSR